MSDDQAAIEPGVRTRRALIAGAGAVGASVLLAGCGDDNPGTTGGPTAGPSAGAQAGTAELTKTSDIPVGGGKVFGAQRVVVTQPTAGQFKGFNAICSHQGCPVTGVDGGTINCSCHGSKYSIQDGSVKNGPATNGLAPKELKIEGDSISLA